MNTNSNAMIDTPTASDSGLGHQLVAFSEGLLRATVVIVLGWVGAMKFTGYEAGAIEGLVASSPLTSWLYSVLTLQGASNLIGTIELLTATLLIVGIWSARASMIGAASSVLTFLVTSSFLLSAPVTEASLGGFPSLSVVPGQFLLKDLVLVAAALYLLGRSLQRAKS